MLLLERAPWPDYWQSVTGSLDTEEESLRDAALQEVAEETGIDAARYPLVDWSIQNEYEIYAEWRWKYAPGVSRNTEHVFGLAVPEPMPDPARARRSTPAICGCPGARPRRSVSRGPTGTRSAASRG